jgi:hypothetical protein
MEFNTKEGDKAVHAHDNDWLQPSANPFGHGCCDCGLYHQVTYRIVDKKGREIKGAVLQMRWSQDRVETARLKHHMLGETAKKD